MLGCGRHAALAVYPAADARTAAARRAGQCCRVPLLILPRGLPHVPVPLLTRRPTAGAAAQPAVQHDACPRHVHLTGVHLARPVVGHAVCSADCTSQRPMLKLV